MHERTQAYKYLGNRSLSSMRNFDFNRYTPRSKKLLRASLKRATNKIQGSLSFLGDLSMRA